MAEFLLRKNCEYTLLVFADSEEEALEQEDPDISNWSIAWSETEAEKSTQ